MNKTYFRTISWQLILIIAIVLVGEHLIKSLLANFSNLQLGAFFSWKVAIIVQTFIVFGRFVKDDSIEEALGKDASRNSIIWIYVLLVIAFGITLVSQIFYDEAKHNHSFWYVLLLDAISWMPIMTFAIFNIYFWIIKDGDYKAYFKKLVLFLDLPFVIPYLTIALVLLFNKDILKDMESLISGVAAFLLLSSNLLTVAFDHYDIKDKAKPEQAVE